MTIRAEISARKTRALFESVPVQDCYDYRWPMTGAMSGGMVPGVGPSGGVLTLGYAAGRGWAKGRFLPGLIGVVQVSGAGHVLQGLIVRFDARLCWLAEGLPRRLTQGL